MHSDHLPMLVNKGFPMRNKMLYYLLWLRDRIYYLYGRAVDLHPLIIFLSSSLEITLLLF